MTNLEKVTLMQAVIPNLKHCKVLGIEVLAFDEGQLVLSLPYSKAIIGNPDTGVIHGGALTTLMDTACGFAAVAALDQFAITPTLDLRIDYMGAAKPGKTVLGEAEVYRVSDNIIFARGMAYHEGERERPIAHCTATFMRIESDVDISQMLKEQG
jgi:uncharacterized protein (TIGR00369 family)